MGFFSKPRAKKVINSELARAAEMVRVADIGDPHFKKIVETANGIVKTKILADLTILRDRAYKRIMEITSTVALMGRVEVTTVRGQLALVTSTQAWINASDAEETVFTACQETIDAINMSQNTDSAIGRGYIISKQMSVTENALLLSGTANLHATAMHEEFLKLHRQTRG